MMRRALGLVIVAACGGNATRTPTPPPTQTPTSPAGKPAATQPAVATTWDQLTGPIRAIEVVHHDTAVEKLFVGEVGKPLDRMRMRTALDAAMAVRGVREVVARGRQRADGITLVITVTLQPRVRKLEARDATGTPIKMTGLTASTLSGSGPLDPGRMDSFVTDLRDRYRDLGFRAVEATWRTTPVEDGVVDVLIEVTPGEALVVGGTTFSGNVAIKSDELGKLIAAFVVIGDPIVDDKVERAVLELNALYYDRGYVNVRITSAVPKSGRGNVAFAIVEGDQYRIGKLTVTSLPAVPAKDVARYLKAFGVKPGEVFSRKAVAAGIERMKALAQVSAVTPLTTVDSKKRLIDVKFQIDP